MKMFDFVGKKRIFFSISAVIIVIGLIGLLINGGFNLDIEFTGGTAININMEDAEYKTDDIAALVKETVSQDSVQVQKTGNENEIIIKTKEIDSSQRTELFQAVKEKYNLKAEAAISETNIGQSTSTRILRDSAMAVLLAVILMLIYITIRFEFRSGTVAVIALIHDVLVMIGIYGLLRLPVNNSFIAAILTIIGYSINNTIVIFDRIRENNKKMRASSFGEIVNTSISQTLGRSINTSITTLLTISVVYFMGVASIKEFALPIIIGLVAGTYSSIFIAGPIWALMKENADKRRRAKNAKRA